MKAAATRRKNAAAAAKHHKTAAKPAKPAAKAKAAPKAKAAKPVRAKRHLTPKQAHARALSIGDVQCCTARALGEHLRRSGWPVADADILALHQLAAGAPHHGASLWDVLAAAQRHGLAGVRPVAVEPVRDIETPGMLLLGVDMPGDHTVLAADGMWLTWGQWCAPCEWPDAVVGEAWQVVWPAWL